jgi:hypothetical protein
MSVKNKRKIQRYLKRGPSDPLENLDLHTKKDRKKKLKLVAGALCHYQDCCEKKEGQQQQQQQQQQKTNSCQYEVYDPVPNSNPLHFRVLVEQNTYGFGRVMVAGGSVTIDVSTKEGGSTTQICVINSFRKGTGLNGVVFVCYTTIEPFESCVSEWKHVVLKDTYKHIKTNFCGECPIGSIIEYNKDPLNVPTDWIMIDKELHMNEDLNLFSNTPVRKKYARLMFETYLICKSNMLEHHPLIKIAAKYVSHLNYPVTLLTRLIQQEFSTLAVEFENDRDGENSEHTMYRRTSRLSGVCGVCKRDTNLVSKSTVVLGLIFNVCEPCFVRLREVCYLFRDLEKLRKTTRKNREWKDLVVLTKQEGVVSSICSFLKNIC